MPRPGARIAHERADIKTLSDLLCADRVLEWLFHPSLRLTSAYESLKTKAREVIKQHPQLLETGWVHLESSICDIFEELRIDTADASKVPAQVSAAPRAISISLFPSPEGRPFSLMQLDLPLPR